jgi:predicted PurR-regulated permease PerM
MSASRQRDVTERLIEAGRGPKAQVPAAETPRPEGLLALAVSVVVVAALYLARDVLIPITLAILLSFLLAPLVKLLRRAYVPKVLAVVLAVLLAFVILLSLGGLIGSQIASLAGQVPQYESTVLQKFESVRNFWVSTAARFASQLGHVGEMAGPAAAPSAPAEQGPQPVPVVIQSSSATASLDLARRFIEPVLSPLGTLGVVVIVAVFILMQQEDLRDRLIRLFGSSDLHRTTLAIDEAGRRLSRYFITQAGINASFGVLIGIGVSVIGLPSPVLWGVLSMLLRFVPYVGSLIAAVIPTALAAAVDPGWSMALWTAGLFLVVEGITGQVVEPLLYGHSTGLSPTAVIVVAIFWSWLWGPIGLILSTPLTLCMVVLGRHVPTLEFFDVLFGDRPALTPVETFYQRLLAGDPDEILEQAETLLKARALSSYYDDIALKALQLAANDVLRGVIDPPQVEALRGDIEALVTELETHKDVDPDHSGRKPDEAVVEVAGTPRPDRETPAAPAPEGTAPPPEMLPERWRTERSVLCVAGRGPLDDAASAMLSQLLRKHGFGSAVAPHESVSRSAISSLDVSGVAMICISYLEMAGSPSHLRYLLRRLRQHAPNRPVLVGLWPADDTFLADRDMRAVMGADYYVSSLREAVSICLEEAHKAAHLPEPVPALAMPAAGE